MKYLFVFVIVSFWACAEAPDYSEIPEIEYEGLSKKLMRQGDQFTDSLYIYFSFKDGDGDIGYADSDPRKDIVVIDTRTQVEQERFKMPMVPEQGTGNGISGEVTVRIYSTCCLFPAGIPPCSAPPSFPTDTMAYEIYILDRAGHESNRIRTDPVVLECN